MAVYRPIDPFSARGAKNIFKPGAGFAVLTITALKRLARQKY